jgi:hypothetical protein
MLLGDDSVGENEPVEAKKEEVLFGEVFHVIECGVRVVYVVDRKH